MAPSCGINRKHISYWYTVKAPLTDSSYERTALSNGQLFGHRFNSYKFVERTLC
jgi:hypothetical protein